MRVLPLIFEIPVFYWTATILICHILDIGVRVLDAVADWLLSRQSANKE